MIRIGFGNRLVFNMYQATTGADDEDNMGQVTEVRLSCYLVLLSIDSKTR